MSTTTNHGAPPATMHAVCHRAFGDSLQALRYTSAPVLIPGRGEVLIKVSAAGISIGDWLIMEGLPLIARPSYGLVAPKSGAFGQEAAGTVVSVGASVHGVDVGDRVFGFARGAFAEYAIARAEDLVHTPDGITDVQAAAAPVSAVAAYQALVREAGTTSGQRVLVLGASGAVGTFAVQIAKALGAHVTAVASARNAGLLAGLGADRVVDYRSEDVTAAGKHWDVVIDLAGNANVRALRAALTPRGTAVIVGGSGGRVFMGFGRTIRAMAANPFVKQKLVPLVSTPVRADLEAVRDLLADGRVTPVIDHTFPLDGIRRAMLHIGQRHAQGKSVVVVDGA